MKTELFLQMGLDTISSDLPDGPFRLGLASTGDDGSDAVAGEFGRDTAGNGASGWAD
jgi:hypothetical protein